MKHEAIFCCAECGPCFGYSPPNIYVYDDCSASINSSTALNNGIVATGLKYFQVREIEVCEITN
jgi:hypothetical protein